MLPRFSRHVVAQANPSGRWSSQMVERTPQRRHRLAPRSLESPAHGEDDPFEELQRLLEVSPNAARTWSPSRAKATSMAQLHQRRKERLSSAQDFSFGEHTPFGSRGFGRTLGSSVSASPGGFSLAQTMPAMRTSGSLPSLHSTINSHHGNRPRARTPIDSSPHVVFENGAFGPPILKFEPDSVTARRQRSNGFISPSASGSLAMPASPSTSSKGSPCKRRESLRFRQRPFGNLRARERLRNASTCEREEVQPSLHLQSDIVAASRQYYTELGSVRAVLESGDAVLVKGSWIAQIAKEGGRLPRRQELPPEATWRVEDLMHCNELQRCYQIIAISHCWLTPSHPDPDGTQLQKLGRFIEAWANTQHGLLPNHMAIFLDWCSLPQEPRSLEEQVAFERALRHTPLWYGHQATHLWVLGNVPDAIPYQQRGWPTLEQSLAALITPNDNVLDLSRLNTGAWHRERGWPLMEEAVTVLITATNRRFDRNGLRAVVAPRQPPKAPRAFSQLLQRKTFSNPADHGMVRNMYAEAFKDIASFVERFDFSGLEWKTSEVDLLAGALPSFTCLKDLNLANNEIDDMGASLLADAIPACGTLQKLFIYDNVMEEGFEGPEQLIEAWRKAGKDSRWLWLSVPKRSEHVAKVLSQ
mmetsp:Transcript_9812/g.25777  ORF Transcript_9812/g.25777 Transcript_9812/m.25777 type:complete len:643 (-) Transcript_9812:146-2074(-)